MFRNENSLSILVAVSYPYGTQPRPGKELIRYIRYKIIKMFLMCKKLFVVFQLSTGLQS